MDYQLASNGRTWQLEKSQKMELLTAEKKRLLSLFRGIKGKKRKVVDSLIDNAAFMAATLFELQLVINQEGAVSTYQNGANQWGTKKAPEIEIYNTMIKNYSNTIKQLTDMVPEEERKEVDDGFERFCAAR